MAFEYLTNVPLEEAREKYLSQGKVLSFIQSHGRLDPVLPYAAAERLFQLLAANGGKGELVGFDGQHEIPQIVLEKVNRWIMEQLS